MSQTPAEENDETSFKTDCLNFLVALSMQIKKRFPLESCCQLSTVILDSIATQDLTKDQSSIANVTIHSSQLAPEDNLESIFGWLIVVLIK